MAHGFRLHKADSMPQEIVKCIHLSGDSVRLGKGDPVKLGGNSAAVGNGPTVQAVARAASGDRVFGVVVGVEQHTVTSGMNLDRTYCPASTAMYVLVRPVRTGDQFVVEEDGDTTPVAATAIGDNANFVAANCSTTTGMSQYTLDSDSAATTNTLDLCIRGFEDTPANADNVGTKANIIVSFNKVQNVDQATGV